MAIIKFNIGTDPVSGKKLKAFFYGDIYFNATGQLLSINYLISYHNTDETDYNPNGSTLNKHQFQPFNDTFICDRYINDTTKVYTTVGQPGAIHLKDYFELKAMNTLPGVANNSPIWKVIEGILKEVIAIKQANLELPV